MNEKYKPDDHGTVTVYLSAENEYLQATFTDAALRAAGFEEGERLKLAAEEGKIVATLAEEPNTCRMCGEELGSGYLCDECEP